MFSSAVHIFSSLVFLSVSLRLVRQAEKDIRDHVALLHSFLDLHHRRQQEVLRQRYKDFLHQILVNKTEVGDHSLSGVCEGRGGGRREEGGEGSESGLDHQTKGRALNSLPPKWRWTHISFNKVWQQRKHLRLG